jgi:TonB family protein
MNYYEEDEKKDRRWAILGVLFYLFVCGGGMMMKHTITMPETLLGIVIDFGSSNSGFGERDLVTGLDDTSPLAPPPTLIPGDPILTTDDGRSPLAMLETRPDQRDARYDANAEARRIDDRTLYSGQTDQSTSTSQGNNNNNQGNRGSRDGQATDADIDTDPVRFETSGWDLPGRSLIGELPRPAYTVEVEGRVVIGITVNSGGIVTSAEYHQAGSTTNHGVLIAAAIDAARKARFTQSDADLQAGTITYLFTLR